MLAYIATFLLLRLQISFFMGIGDNNVNLPPGFRFSPSDEELIVHFLQRKASLLPCHPDIIPDLDVYPYDPWDLDGTYTRVFLFNTSSCKSATHIWFWLRMIYNLPIHPMLSCSVYSYLYVCMYVCICAGNAMEEGKKWYYYSRRTQSRITSNGFWNPIGEDEPILSSKSGSKRKAIGIKKYYVFYAGEPNSEGIKTNWILQEFSLCDHGGSSSSARRKSKNVIHLAKQL